MTTNSEDKQANEILSPEKNMQIVDDSRITEQENMEGINKNLEDAEICDVEEGELPEEGEIMDDEEESQVTETPETSESTQKPVAEKSAAENQSTSQSVTATTTTTVTVPKEAESSVKSPASKEEETNAKKRGPSSPIGDPYATKRQALSPDVPQLPPRRRQPWTEAILCKFFREGYCRDGETCAYSHNAAHSNRKPELCKFYQQGFCKKGLACTLLHGEYPCKAYHEGKCDKSPCKYSHMPLNDYTRAIFEQMVQDEALAAKIVIPMQPAKRKVLLRRPNPNSEPQHAKASPRREEHQSLAVLADSAHDFDPSKFNSENEIVNESPPFVAMTSAQDPDEQLVADNSSFMPENQKPFILSPEASNDVPDASGMSITDMLDQITEQPVASSNVINLEDLMKSPTVNEPATVLDTPQSPPKVAKERMYRLIPLSESAPDYDISFLKKITSDRFKDDPRIQSIVQKQFDRASNMFGKNMPGPSKSPPQKASLLGDRPSLTKDPRLRAGPVDPRQRTLLQTPINGPPHSQVPINGAPPAFPINNGPMNTVQPVAAMDDAHFKSLVEKQLQMVNEFKLNDSDGNNYNEQRYDEGPHGRFREDEEQYRERRDYDRGYPERGGYNERGAYNNYDERPSRFDEPYQSYEEESHYRGESRYPPPPSRGSGTRGSRGFHEAERYPRRQPPAERFDSRWEGGRSDSYRREQQQQPYHRERERRDYNRTGSSRFRERSRSRSPQPRRNEPPIEERPLTLREKRKNNEYQSPLARA
uniref:C3H1-type domain-containing protein n=1 Tax=Panagrolaimus superbus TaxID=310955 RepID=A0A914Z7J8_9BILA